MLKFLHKIVTIILDIDYFTIIDNSGNHTLKISSNKFKFKTKKFKYVYCGLNYNTESNMVLQKLAQIPCPESY